MGQLAVVGGRDVPAISTPETRHAYETLLQSRAWYAMQDLPEAKLREMVPAIADCLPGALAEVMARLAPAPPAQVNLKLTELLTLSAPAGFNDDDRTEWLAAAANATKGIPSDLLDMAFKAAREKADHPAKIIPAMMASFKGPWSARRSALGRVRRLVDAAQAPQAQDDGAGDRLAPSEVEDANRLMRRFGLATRYRADGSQFQLQPGEADPTAPATDPAG